MIDQEKIDAYFDKHWSNDMNDQDFERKLFRTFGAVWFAILIGNFAFWGVVIWAIITLVNKA